MKNAVKGCLIFLIALGFGFSQHAKAQTPGSDIQSRCGSVTGGAVNYMAWECWNDAIFQVVNSENLDANGWQYTLDGGAADFAGPSGFDICGMGFRETANELWFTINAGLPLETGYPMIEALNGSVAYGDLFINLSGLDFASAHEQGRLFAIHYAAGNDSSMHMAGVYGNVVARSVVALNDGPNNRQGYENHINNIVHGTVGYGDLPINQTYFGMNMGLNVIENGTFLGPISFVNSTELGAAGYNSSLFGCPVTVSFKIQKQLIIDECGVVGGDGSSCRDCAGVACGETTLDLCGVCGGDGSSCRDCAGTANGGAQLDLCGVCGGDGSSCLDCSGVPNGISTLDRCGVCNGDGFSCCECTESDISAKLEEMQSKLMKLFKLNKKNFKRLSRPNVKKIISRLGKQNQALYEQAVALIASIPAIARVCKSTEFCRDVVSNQNIKADYLKVVKKMGKLTGRIPRPKGGACNRSSGCGTVNGAGEIRRIQKQNGTSAADVPGITSVCS